MTKQRAWESKWTRGDKIGGGGQGTTYKVVSKNLSANGTTYVLKILKNQTDPDRRARMHREVTALKALVNSSIPQVVDTNADQYLDSNVELYFVTEFIDGPTLEALPDRPIDIVNAVNLVISMLKVIQYCHSEGVIHRDIKPENIIVRNGNLLDPVIIDFGLSFNQDPVVEENLTATGQHLGNRFLMLPELTVSESGKRDPRSDITSCCGIFFYLLTGIIPSVLLDGEGAMPHQRVKARAVISTLDPEKRSLINGIFDTGFEMKVDRRWQSVEALHSRLLDILNATASDRGTVDFVAWSGLVLNTFLEFYQADPIRQMTGVDVLEVEAHLFGEETESGKYRRGIRSPKSVYDAVYQLEAEGFLRVSGRICHVTPRGEQYSGNVQQIWNQISHVPLNQDQKNLLKVVNRLSVQVADGIPWLQSISGLNTVLTELGWAINFDQQKQIQALAQRLSGLGLIKFEIRAFPHSEFTATYKGLVWEMRQTS